jgi:hypothetical protein
MRWSAEERLKRALPYGMWAWWDDEGWRVETLFNRHYTALATRAGGQPVPKRYPPAPQWPVALYYFGLETGTFPWRDAATRERCRLILRNWGIDPSAIEAEAAAAIREEHRAWVARQRWRR